MDTDGDGVSNTKEIAAGTDHFDADSSPPPDLSETVGEFIYADNADATVLAGAEANLKLWLDASNINGDDNDGITSGQGIAAWNDLSGNGNHAVSVANRFPTLTTDALGPAIQFSGLGGVVVADEIGVSSFPDPVAHDEWFVRSGGADNDVGLSARCLLYTSPSPRDVEESRMPSSA